MALRFLERTQSMRPALIAPLLAVSWGLTFDWTGFALVLSAAVLMVLRRNPRAARSAT